MHFAMRLVTKLTFFLCATKRNYISDWKIRQCNDRSEKKKIYISWRWFFPAFLDISVPSLLPHSHSQGLRLGVASVRRAFVPSSGESRAFARALDWRISSFVDWRKREKTVATIADAVESGCSRSRTAFPSTPLYECTWGMYRLNIQTTFQRFLSFFIHKFFRQLKAFLPRDENLIECRLLQTFKCLYNFSNNSPLLLSYSSFWRLFSST